MKILVASTDAQAVEALRRNAGPGWEVLSLATAEEALTRGLAWKPHLVISDAGLPDGAGWGLLRALQARAEPIPAMAVLAAELPDAAQGAQAAALKLQDILTVPLDDDAVQRLYAPYFSNNGPPRMSLLEFLASGHAEVSNRQVDLLCEGHQVSVIFGLGYFWGILHPHFGSKYRQALADGSLDVQDAALEDLVGEAAMEERLGPSRELAGCKTQAVLSVLSTLPLDGAYTGRLCEVVIPEGLLPIDIPTLLASLVEHLPQKALALLKSPGLRVKVSPGVIPPDLPIKPHQGYLLSLCQLPLPVQELLQMGSVSEQQALSSLYLLLLLGLLATEPPVHGLFRLSALRQALEEEAQHIERQGAAIGTLVRDFQRPGIGPYEILGIRAGAGLRDAESAYAKFDERLSPPRLHPEVLRRNQASVLLLKAKLGEALLLIQSGSLKDKHLEAPAGSPAEAAAEEGEEAARKALQVREAEKLLAMARHHIQEERPFDAAQCLKLALHYNASLSEAHHLMGKIHMRLKDERAAHMAERELLAALQLDPQNVNIHYDLAEFYLIRGLQARSRACFSRAYRMDPKNPRVPEMRAAMKLREH